MAFRVYDTEQEYWVFENIYLTQNDDLYIAKNGLFGFVKLSLEKVDRYVVHRDIGLIDKNEVLIYEGDFVKAEVGENKIVVGLVTYAHELSAYIILCYDTNEYFTLGSEVCDLIEVVGNVFDGKKNGEQALQE